MAQIKHQNDAIFTTKVLNIGPMNRLGKHNTTPPCKQPSTLIFL